jgi:all-trans-retinol 13,14-reductase
MKKYDIVIIGSGFGGLICGYLLSKNGYRVAVFEKHYQIGGCLQTFERKGVTFDTGMHYVGSLDKDQLLFRIFKYLGLLNDVKTHRLDTAGFDHILIKDKEYKFAMGFENFADTLSQYFPDERKTIARYVSDLRHFSSVSPITGQGKNFYNEFLSRDSIKTGVGTYFDSLTDNLPLQNVLSATNMLYAGRRNKTPLYIHALISSFYINSAWRIVGGANTIAASLRKSFEGFGGEIFTNSEVTRINCDTKKAISITLNSGEDIESKFFISNTHPENTLRMLDTPLIKRIYRERISDVENTVSNFALYIEFKPNTTPYLNYNIYRYNNQDVWDCANYSEKEWPKNYIFMHQVPINNSPFAESGIVIAYMQFNEVAKWSETKIERRGEDYLQFKERKKEVLLQQLENDFPGIRANIKNVYASSPLTLRDYTGTKEGSMYGILKDKNKLEQSFVSHRTKIPNLFFTGQNINSHGILGVGVGAFITSSEFVDLEKDIREIF